MGGKCSWLEMEKNMTMMMMKKMMMMMMMMKIKATKLDNHDTIYFIYVINLMKFFFLLITNVQDLTS